MTADNRRLDPAIAAWLADEATLAASETRRAISAAIRRTPQRRALRQADLVRLGRFMVVAALLVGIAALALASGGFPPSLPTPGPTSSDPAGSPPAVTRSEAILDRGDRQIAFSYQLPAAWDVDRLEVTNNAGLVLFASAGGEEWYAADGLDSVPPNAHGLAVADVTGATEHGSTVFRPVFGATAEEFVRGLDASDYFVTGDVGPTNVGGTPGWIARVRTEGDWWSHIDVYPPGDRTGSVQFGAPNVTWFVDVGGAVVVVVAWADTEAALQDWLPQARAFVDSIRFESVRPSVAPS